MPRDLIIDSHVHLKHGDLQKTEYSAEAIVKIMDEAQIDKSVVFAMSTTTSRSIDMACRAVSKFEDRLIPYVYALPSYEKPVIEEIENAISNLGFRGIKIHMGECTLERYVTEPVLRLAGRLNVPCLIDCIGRYDLIEEMTRAFPETKIIVAHMGKYLCEDESLIDRFIQIAKSYKNIFLDVSGVVIPRKIKEAVEILGSSRIIFGTDGPKPEDLNPEDERAVLGGTISRLLGI